MDNHVNVSQSKPSPGTQGQRRGFQWRAFVSVTTGLSFVGMSVTGLALFVTPPGRVAHWTGWTLLGLTKDQWGGLHIWLSLVFLIAAVLHLWLNWKPLVSYFKSRLRKTFALRWEWVSALAVCVLVFWGTLAEMTPFSDVLTLNERIKHSWDRSSRQAPIPHAELMTFSELAQKDQGLDVEAMMRNLREGGIEVESAQVVLGELATRNHMTPDQLYNIAIGGHHGPGAGGRGRGTTGGAGQGPGHGAGGDSGQRGGRGMGRLTLQQYCEQAGLDVEVAVRQLQDKGLEAAPNTPIREIATSGNLHPSAIRDIIGP